MTDHHFDQNSGPSLNSKPVVGQKKKTNCRRKTEIWLNRRKYPYLKRISWPLFKEAFLRVFEIGWNWMMLDAHSSMNLVARHFIATFWFWHQKSIKNFWSAGIHGNEARKTEDKLLPSFKSRFQAGENFFLPNGMIPPTSPGQEHFQCRSEDYRGIQWYTKNTINEHDTEVSRHGGYPNSWMVCNWQ